jgi:hypothetical protein
MTELQCQDLGGLWELNGICALSPCVGLCCTDQEASGCVSGVAPDECVQSWGGTFVTYSPYTCTYWRQIYGYDPCQTGGTTTVAPATTTIGVG